ncbi:MAG: AzlC family ABC transporter permease [Ahrensia sp.]|nr:AzlC family ABC transporter permease [Ahrensia sp.]
MENDEQTNSNLHRYWLLKGMREALCLPTLLLMCAFVGFAGFAKESGITLPQALVMTSMIWALPACVVLVTSISNGATLFAAFIAVTLSSARMMPMAIALIPEMRTKDTRTWVLLILSHFVAITAWVIALRQFKDVPKAFRTSYFGGLAGTITLINQFVVAIVFLSANSLPPKVLGALFFLTPIYFIVSLWGSAREQTGKIAMVVGLILGPVFHIYLPGFDLLATGFIGGTLAYFIGRTFKPKVAKS